jgi:general secretion pathway protein D
MAVLAGCTTPQSLIMPHPPTTNTASELEYEQRRRPGVPLGAAADQSAREGSYLPGTGDLVGSPDPRPVIAPPSGRDGVTLSLSEASIASAAKVVLGDMLRQSYTISDKVKGTITLQTPQPVTRARLLEMFEAALQSQGAGIVTVDGTARILPIEEAIASGAPILPRGATGRNVAGINTEVVQLRHVSAPEMERLLKSVAPASTAIRIDQQRNIIIATGTRNDLAALRDAVAVFDVDWMRGMSFAMFPVESADPEAIAQELDVVFANDREGAGKGVVRFVPNRRLKSILVISARQEYLGRAEGWLRKLDMVGRATEKQVHVYHVQNRPAQELAQLLQRVYAGQEQTRGSTALVTGSTAPAGSTQTSAPAAVFDPVAVAPTRAAATQTTIPGLPALPVSPLPPAPRDAGGNATTPAVAGLPALDAPASGRPATEAAHRPIDDRATGISIVPDEHNNSLVITATAAEFRRMRQILARVDVAPSQVLLEATIAEVTLNDELKLGMRWFFQSGRSQFKLTDSLLGSVGPVAPGFSYFLNKVNVQVVLNALQSITNVNIVSSPSLMVLDNKKATLQVGDEVPFPTQSAVGVLAPGAPLVNTITTRNTGIILGITPRISDNGRILLDIEQEVSDAVATTSSTIDAPTIQQRKIRTTVAVNDGESIVLAGLIQDKATRERAGVPKLLEIPVVGNLFKDKTDTIKRTELLIAITPRIVNDKHQMRDVVEEFRGKLNFNTRPQRERLPSRREQLDRLQR